MPVLPLVASINTSPGLISPRFSASTIIESAARSFTEPAGLFPSSLTQISLPLSGPRRCSFTRGVLPIVCSNVFTVLPNKKAGKRLPGLQTSPDGDAGVLSGLPNPAVAKTAINMRIKLSGRFGQSKLLARLNTLTTVVQAGILQADKQAFPAIRRLFALIHHGERFVIPPERLHN